MSTTEQTPDVLSELDMPITSVGIDPYAGLLNREMLRYYLSEPKKPVMIATPDNWREPYGYAEFFMLNGVGFIVKADEIVMVPESLKMLMDDRKAVARELNQQEADARKRLRYTRIDQVPEWIH